MGNPKARNGRRLKVQSRIIDAEGMFHDLALGAFDAFTIKHPNEPAKINKELFNQPLTALAETAKELAAKGIHDFGQYLGAAIGGAAGAGATLLFGAETISGPVGAVAGAALEYGAHWLFDFHPDDKVAYGQGQWVIMDFGMKLEKKLYKRGFAEDPFFEDIAGEVEKPDRQVGFFIDVSTTVGDITVWDFELGTPYDISSAKVQAVPKEQALGFDRNEAMSTIREIYFAKETGNTLNSDIPTDPGSEVLYDGRLFTIVDCEGLVAKIQDQSGNMKHVDIADLKRGRVTNNRSWHYRKHDAQWMYAGEKDETAGELSQRLDRSLYYNPDPGRASFMRDGEGAIIYQGQWVWLKANEEVTKDFPKCENVLACVSYVENELVKLYRALDGRHQYAEEAECIPVQVSLLTTFEKDNDFMKFVDAAVRGFDVVYRKLALDHLAICLGLSNTGENAKKIIVRRFEPVPISGRAEGEVGPPPKKSDLMAAPMPGGDTNKAAKQTNRGLRRDRDGHIVGKSMETQGRVEARTPGAFLGKAGRDTVPDNTMLYVLGGVCVLGAVYFIR